MDRATPRTSSWASSFPMRTQRAMAAKKNSDGLSPVLAWIALLWLIEATDIVVTRTWHPTFAQGGPWSGGWLDAVFGIEPWTLKGLLCIPTAPLMHANWAHVGANSIGL